MDNYVFHAKDGWHFSRKEDGSVRMEKLDFTGDIETVPMIRESVEFDAGTWASIVASVSARHETTETYYEALAFHNKVATPTT